jgi:hypothetical protein
MKRSLIAALAFSSLLAGCIIPIPIPGPRVQSSETVQPNAGPGTAPIDAEACASRGGIVRTGSAGASACAMPYRDAGKACTDGGECEGDCWARSEEKAPDGLVHGQCQADNTAFGCHGRVESGRLEGPMICVD